MLKVNNLIGFGGSGPVLRTLDDIITNAGATTDLNVCLDAGDASSYSGSGSTWTDVSGSGNDYSKVSAPTFNGTAGILNADTYWSFNGSSCFEEATAYTYYDSWSGNNQNFTIIAVFYPISSKSSTSYLFADRNINASEDGVMFGVTTAHKVEMRHNTSTSTTETITSTAALSADRFNFIAASFDDNGPSCELRINGTSETPSVTGIGTTITSVRSARIGYDYAGSPAFFESGERLICTAHWSRKLTATELENIYQGLKSRLGLP